MKNKRKPKRLYAVSSIIECFVLDTLDDDHIKYILPVFTNKKHAERYAKQNGASVKILEEVIHDQKER